jgi:hypothetical protein
MHWRFAATLAVVIPLLACVKQTAAAEDEGHTTTTQTATESGDPDVTSGTSSEGSETEETEETNETGFSFVPEEDFTGLCSISELSLCDEFLQDCPGDEKCVPFHIEDCSFPVCTLVTGDKSAGEPCTADEHANDDCDADSWCYPGTLDLEQPSVCVSFCQGTADNSFCDDPSLTCVIDYKVYGGALGCLPICDPLTPGGCEPWERCTFTFDGQSEFGCVIGGGVANGEVCNYNQDCDSGVCVEAESLLECAGEKCCSPWCDIMAPDCAMGLECMPVDVGDPISNVGACSVP